MKDVLRTDKCLDKYRAKRSKMGKEIHNVDLTNLPHVLVSKYWILVENEFPYDNIASVHHMLIPRRKFTNENDMGLVERRDLINFKKLLGERYDCYLDNAKHNRTIPAQYHIHCIKFKYVTPIEKL